jgi:hypothetical protein
MVLSNDRWPKPLNPAFPMWSVHNDHTETISDLWARFHLPFSRARGAIRLLRSGATSSRPRQANPAQFEHDAETLADQTRIRVDVFSGGCDRRLRQFSQLPRSIKVSAMSSWTLS